MIIAGKVQHAMQDEHLNFICGSVPQALRILAGNLGANGYITPRDSGKRKHIRSLVFPAETTVQRLHLASRGNQYGDVSFDPSQILRSAGKTLQCREPHTIYRFLEDDHVLQKRTGGLAGPPVQILLNYCCKGGS